MSWLWGDFNERWEQSEWNRASTGAGSNANRLVGLAHGQDGALYIGADFDADGNAAAGARYGSEFTLCAIDGQCLKQWEGVVDWPRHELALWAWDSDVPNWHKHVFVRNGKLHIAFANQGSQKGLETSGEVSYKGPEMYPILLTADSSGSFRIENICDVPGNPSYASLRRFGKHIVWSGEKKARALVCAEIQ